MDAIHYRPVVYYDTVLIYINMFIITRDNMKITNIRTC